MAKKHDSYSGGSLEDEVSYVLGNLLAKHEHRVDGLLKRLSVGTNDGRKALRRLDRAFLTVAAGTGVAKGLGSAARRNLKIPAGALNKVSSVGLLSMTALYILGHARVRGISTSDPRVQEAVRNALLASAALPIGQMMLDNLARFARPSVGLPTDPRTWFVIAAGVAGGGISGNAIGQGIVESVYEAFGDFEGPVEMDFKSADQAEEEDEVEYLGVPRIIDMDDIRAGEYK